MLKQKGREEKTGRICLIPTAKGLTPGQARQKPETRWAMKANKYKRCSKSARKKQTGVNWTLYFLIGPAP